MTLDSYVTLGRSGLRISPLCLGGMTFGEDWGWGASVSDSEAILCRFLEHGGNFIDTANFYTAGHSEAIIGDFIGHERSRRDRIVIATKFSGNMYPGDPNAGGSGAKTIIEACEQSLRRLQTDYIDLYWIHHWDPHTPIEESMRTLDRLVQSGKVRYIGYSNAPAWKVAQAQMLATFRGWAPLIALQIEYSLLERTVEDELTPMAGELGLGIVPWSPLRGGLLSGKYTRANAGGPSLGRVSQFRIEIGEREYSLIDELIAVGKGHNANAAAIALAWVRSRPGVAAPVVGVRTLAQLDANLSALDVVLSVDEITKLDALSLPPATFLSRMRPLLRSIMQNGVTVNGVVGEPCPLSPPRDGKRY
jgi:aryl-alcohol dehydrogenase-like predicted oxidoreductase